MKIQRGPINRTRSSHRKYVTYLEKEPKDASCIFCRFDESNPDIISNEGDFWVFKNIFGYDVWDGHSVGEHLLIAPKRHIRTLGDLTKKEKAAYVDIVGDYEKRGYSLYSRADQNKNKSIPHQHTHLIKLTDKRAKLLFYAWAPHVLFFK